MSFPDRYFDDFSTGDAFDTGAFEISAKESTAFAHLYDPQPFHLDDDAARASVFREVTVSGWHTAAITMRLIVETGILRATGIIGTGIDDLRWIAPVYPGDTLHVHGEIIEKAAWPGSTTRGAMRVRLDTLNQHEVVVMSQIANLMVAVRPATA